MALLSMQQVQTQAHVTDRLIRILSVLRTAWFIVLYFLTLDQTVFFFVVFFTKIFV